MPCADVFAPFGVWTPARTGEERKGRGEEEVRGGRYKGWSVLKRCVKTEKAIIMVGVIEKKI